MLYEFLSANQADLIKRCQDKVSEFHTLNRLLDNAIAAAVTEYCSPAEP